VDSNNIDLDLVREYVNGTLPEEQLKALEERLKQDQTFAEEFEHQKELVESVVLFNRTQLKQQLSSEDKSGQKSSTLGSGGRRWWLAAASLVLMVVAGYFLLWDQVDNEQLFSEYYQPYYNVLADNQRSGNGVSNAMKWYDQGDYTKALESLNNESIDAEGRLISFYKGICYLELNQIDQAESVFTNLKQQPDFELHQAAHWYLGLSYLKGGNLVDAKNVFKELADKKGPYQQRAQQVLTSW